VLLMGRHRDDPSGDPIAARCPGRIFYRIFYRIIRDRPLRSVRSEQALLTKAQVSGTIEERTNTTQHGRNRAHNPKVEGSNPSPATNLDAKAQVSELGLPRWVGSPGVR
jgi:hypothetical protein